jgi:hypothetical protein
MADNSRKWLGRAAQLALVVLAAAFVVHWVRSRVHLGSHDTHVAGVAPPPDSLGPGDLRIYNSDSTVDLVLVGDKIAAGLSPKTVAEVRRKMDSSSQSDTGLGGSIASMIKHTVAGAIGTHVEFKLADLNDVRYEDGKLVFDWKKGSQHSLFDDAKVNGKTASNTFLAPDATRFIDAVHARQKELGLP